MRYLNRDADLGLKSELWTEDPEMREGTQGQKKIGEAMQGIN